MADMDEFDFADMVEQTPVKSFIIEYREPSIERPPRQLVGACLTDQQGDGLSMIYSFFDPDHAEREGLGTFIILDHIRRAARPGSPYVYLGYWVDGSARMQYKTRFRPVERTAAAGWQRFDPPDAADAGRARAAAVEGTAIRSPDCLLCGTKKPVSLSLDR